MEQRDVLKDQIEQLSRALGKILTGFLGMKASGQIAQGFKFANEQLQQELNIDVQAMKQLSKDELRAFVVELNLNSKHLDLLAEYFKELGEEALSNNRAVGVAWLNKAYELLDLAGDLSETLSLDRLKQKNELVRLLNNE